MQRSIGIGNRFCTWDETMMETSVYVYGGGVWVFLVLVGFASVLALKGIAMGIFFGMLKLFLFLW